MHRNLTPLLASLAIIGALADPLPCVAQAVAADTALLPGLDSGRSSRPDSAAARAPDGVPLVAADSAPLQPAGTTSPRSADTTSPRSADAPPSRSVDSAAAAACATLTADDASDSAGLLLVVFETDAGPSERAAIERDIGGTIVGPAASAGAGAYYMRMPDATGAPQLHAAADRLVQISQVRSVGTVPCR